MQQKNGRSNHRAKPSQTALFGTIKRPPQLKGQSDPFLPLLTAFEGVVAQQIGYVGTRQNIARLAA